jgi:hypothetical protein
MANLNSSQMQQEKIDILDVGKHIHEKKKIIHEIKSLISWLKDKKLFLKIPYFLLILRNGR